jgi:hypothetical protein
MRFYIKKTRFLHQTMTRIFFCNINLNIFSLKKRDRTSKIPVFESKCGVFTSKICKFISKICKFISKRRDFISKRRDFISKSCDFAYNRRGARVKCAFFVGSGAENGLLRQFSERFGPVNMRPINFRHPERRNGFFMGFLRLF